MLTALVWGCKWIRYKTTCGPVRSLLGRWRDINTFDVWNSFLILFTEHIRFSYLRLQSSWSRLTSCCLCKHEVRPTNKRSPRPSMPPPNADRTLKISSTKSIILEWKWQYLSGFLMDFVQMHWRIEGGVGNAIFFIIVWRSLFGVSHLPPESEESWIPQWCLYAGRKINIPFIAPSVRLNMQSGKNLKISCSARTVNFMRNQLVCMSG